jgi:predicted kinase
MNIPRFILLCGICGAGKSTYGKGLAKEINAAYFASDDIRVELRGDDKEYHPEDNEKVFQLMQSRTLETLENGQDVIYDATNVTRKDRASILAKIPVYARKECHIVWAPIETCIEQDSRRERHVGKEVIDKMLKRFQTPFYDEGIDEIVIVRPEGWDWEAPHYSKKCFEDMRIPHDNPHHKLNVLEHCWEAKKYLFDYNITDEDLNFAALRHDIGKPYVKAFVNSKGEPCEYAHYYQHQCVGSWMSYGFEKVTPFSAWLISSHMEPFFNSKYYKNLPTFLKESIDILHEADLEAH